MPPFDAASLEFQRRLVARMAAGEGEALRDFHELNAGRVHGVAARILANREDIREVVQDTFVKAWRQAGTYRQDRGEAISWLLFIARNTAIDRARQGARRRALLESAAIEEAAAAGRPPGRPVENRDYIQHLLRDLSPAQRQALDLAFFSGCTQPEIARRMETPVGNVKNHLRRGLLKLRQLSSLHD